MKGARELTAWRVCGRPIEIVHIALAADGESARLTTADFVWRGDDGRSRGQVFVGPSDVPETLDLRFILGLDVVVFADRYDAGAPVLLRAIEFDPVRASLAAPDGSARWTPEEGFTAWI